MLKAIGRFLKWQFATVRGWLTILWAWIPVWAVIFDGILHLFFPGVGDWIRGYEVSFLKMRLFPDGANIWHATGLFWAWVMVWLAISIWMIAYRTYKNTNRTGPQVVAGAVVMAILLGGAPMTAFWRANQGADRDLAVFESRAGHNTWITPYLDAKDPRAADGIRKLLERSRAAKPGEECDRYATDGIFGCIKQGDLPDDGWNQRSASFTGAKNFMSAASATASGVKLIDKTLNYIPDAPGYWTGIVGGEGKLLHDYGVSTWDGRGPPKICTFHEGYKLNRALLGEVDNSMTNLLSETFPGLYWEIEDVSGYCDGDNPVFVVPMVDRSPLFRTRTVAVSGGTVIIRGSESGVPVFEYRASVKAGELPVPVYPISLARQQREDLQWVNGRRWKDQGKIGFATITADSQTANASEYLLAGADGNDWVSPLTPKGNDSQLVTAYAVLNASSATAGTLNQMNVYVLRKGDPRVVSLDLFEKPIRSKINEIDPAFFNSGGTLNEYLPTKDGTWQVYGEVANQPKYRILVRRDAATEQITVNITIVSANEAATVTDNSAGAASTGTCKAQMTPAEALACIRGAAGQLEPPKPTPSPAVSPSPSATRR